jgi:uncharacterized phiE125 gp8 family phage protein
MVTVSSYTPISVNLTELKAFCRVDGSADDALLTMLFGAAVEEFNSYTGYRLGATTVTVDTTGEASYTLPLGPVTAITSVTAYDDEGNATTLALYTDYDFINTVITLDEVPPRMRIIYTCGDTNPPADIKHALYQRVKFGYDYGDDLPYNTNRFFDRLAFRYRQNFS